MKTKLTLNVGAFYFLSTVNLMRSVASEIDLSTLNVAELKGLKSYVKSGSISSSEDIFKYEIPSTELKQIKEVVEETVEEVLEAKEEPKEVEEEVEEVNYETLTKVEILKELSKRKIQTKLTRKDQLIDLLKESDSK